MGLGIQSGCILRSRGIIPYSVTSLDQLGSRLLVLYDGRCGFCNKSIRWFLRHDALDRLRFAPSDAPLGADLLARHGFDASALPEGPDTILVVRNTGTPREEILVRSNGVVAMLAALPQPWPGFGAALHIIPRPLRDLGYRFIARIRYRIWGRYDTCPIPTAAERAHFL